MRTLSATLAAIVLFCSCASGQLISDPWLRGASSVAVNDDATAVFTNPGALGLYDETSMYSALSMAGEDVSAVRVGVKLGPFGLGYHREYLWEPLEDAGVHPSTDAVDTYVLGLAFGDPGSFSFGVGYRWLRAQYGENEKAETWDAGLVYRPTDYLSIGGVLRNISEPRFGGGILEAADEDCDPCGTRMTYAAGVAVRPIGNRLTLMADASLPRDEDIDRAVYTLGAEAEVMDGLVLRGSIQTYPEGDDRDEESSVGLWFNTTHVGAGASMRTFEPSADEIVTYAFGSSDERMRSVIKPQGLVAEVEVSGPLSDVDPGWSLLGEPATSAQRRIADIRRAAKDSSVGCLLLRIRRIESGFLGGPSALAEEIRNEIVRARTDRGKKVLAYLEYGASSPEYFIASAADVIMMDPVAVIMGISNYTTIMRYTGTSEKVGIEWDYLSAGKYKSTFHSIGPGPLTDEQRSEVQSLVDDIYGRIADAIVEGRGLPREVAEPLCDGRPFSAPEAVEVGLADSLASWEDAKAAATRLAGATPPDDPEDAATVDVSSWRDKAYDWKRGPTIAIVGAYGGIGVGKGGHDPLLGGQSIGSETLVQQLRRARKDPRVKAVILRIDSGGGDALASDIIWRETVKVAAEKPFIVSMADIAGSGGYHIACAAERVFVDPLTITGSIGVATMKPSLGPLYDKIDATHETFKRGKYADLWSATRRATDEEIAMGQDLIDWFYDDFVEKVASGRRLPEERVRELAQGRVYTGSQAVPIGLADELGGLSEAIDYACAKIGTERERARLALYREGTSLLDQLFARVSAKLRLWRMLDLGGGDPQDLVQYRMTSDIIGN